MATGSSRLRASGGLAALAALAALLISLTGCGGSDDRANGTQGPSPSASAAPQASKIEGIAETKELLDGVEQHGLVLGDPRAPVTLVEIVDLQCPFCQKHQLDVQPRVIDDFVRTGKVQLHLVPVSFLGADSQRMEVVFLRLAKQDKAWEFANLVYWNQGKEGSGYATDAWLRAIVGAIPGTDPDAASTTPDADITKTAAASLAVAQSAVRAAGGGGTPFFSIGPTGTPLTQLTPILTGAPPDGYEQLARAVRAVDSGKPPKRLHIGPPVTAPPVAKGA